MASFRELVWFLARAAYASTYMVEILEFLPCKLKHKLHMLKNYELPEDGHWSRLKHVSII
jgi:hypothetical protein